MRNGSQQEGSRLESLPSHMLPPSPMNPSSELRVYNDKLDKEGLLAQLEDPGPRPFLRRVLLPLLDSDHDSMVVRPWGSRRGVHGSRLPLMPAWSRPPRSQARSELLLLEYQFGPSRPDRPIDIQELLDAVYAGFNRKMLAKRQEVNKALLGKISGALQVLLEDLRWA